MSFDTRRFHAAVIAQLKSKQLSLRDAAKQSGVSPATLSRLTKGEIPDMTTFARIITWLNADASTFFTGVQEGPGVTYKQEIQAWADPARAVAALGMPQEFSEAVITLIRLMREIQGKSKEAGEDPVG